MLKKRIFVLIFLLVFVVCSFAKQEVLKFDDVKYRYEITPRKVVIENITNGEIVFSKQTYDNNNAYLNTGFSELLDTFYIIKETMSFNNKYSITLITEENNYLIFEELDNPIYSPLIFEKINNNSIYLIYIDENFSINIYDIRKKQIIFRKFFHEPILSLEISGDGKYLKFKKFDKGEYREAYFIIEELFQKIPADYYFIDKNINKNHSLFKNADENLLKSKYAYFNTEDFNQNLDLDYRKFVGFGDSITYGYVNSSPAPELGYIPRLEKLINSELYSGEVINEGIPAETTDQAVERIEEVIKYHKGKYLLFHEGTNDAILLGFSLSTIYFNIEFIIKKSLDYDLLPVVSTLIPRNGWFGGGIFKQRSIQISEKIKEFSQEYNLELIDFWDIFSNYPESKGGYDSLISDVVHPSCKGYQLMAEKWLDALQALPPDVPVIESFQYVLNTNGIAGLKIKLEKSPNPDFDNFIIYYGKEKNDISELYLETKSKEIEVFLPPNYQYYIGVTAVDTLGNESDLSRSIEYKSFKVLF